MTTRVTRSKSVGTPAVAAAAASMFEDSFDDSVNENVIQTPREPKSRGRRARTPKKSSLPKENKCNSPSSRKDLATNKVGLAKRALHTSIPSELPCREGQIDFIYKFLNEHFLEKRGGGLYISGSPGTGKTACITHVLDKLKGKKGKGADFVSVFINCMNLGNPNQIYEHIAITLRLTNKGTELKESVTKRFTSKTGKMILVVLDEMDQLLNSRGNDVLYKMFEMTQLPDAKLILVGIANSLDLTTRHLPYLATTSSPVTAKVKRSGSFGSAVARAKTPIELFHFTPYERDEIAQILETRLREVEGLFDPMAIKLVASKVASSTGDMRKALNACKTTLDQLEKEERVILKTTADDGFNSSSPKKARVDIAADEKIGIGSIAKVLGNGKDDESLPIQQLLLLATLLRLHRQLATNPGPVPPIPLCSVYQEYGRLSERKGFEFIDMSDIVSIFAMLEDRSLVSFSHSSTTPSSRKGLKVNSKGGQGMEAVTCDPKKLELILQKSDLFDSIVYSY